MAKQMGGERVLTKSGLMVGLGEEFDEMVETFRALREHRVQILTVGQYLRPTRDHLPVVRYWHPEEFEALREAALELGFESVASGPLVRSSYHADEAVAEVAARRGAVAASRRRPSSRLRPSAFRSALNPRAP
jgi:lipoic acid synthetase